MSCTNSPFRSALGGKDRPAVHPERLVPGDAMPLSLLVTIVLLGSEQTPARPSRVRWESPVVAAAIRQGLERSRTFRDLVSAIDTTDGVVYVLEGQCGHGVRACLHMSIEISNGNRLLRVFVNPRRAPGCELVGSIGHELQHAIEVLNNPSIRSSAALSSFFSRMRHAGPRRFETVAAEQIGRDIDQEICDTNQ
jgi:hypothetical protein